MHRILAHRSVVLCFVASGALAAWLGATMPGERVAGGRALAQEPPSWQTLEPLFAERCVMCHAGPDAPLGLQLDSYENALKGSVNGPVLVAGDPDGSELVRRIRGESEPRMPLVGEPLSAAEIAAVETWVAEGLPEGAAEPASEVEEGAQASQAQAADPLPGRSEPVTFAHVEPIFLRECTQCHSAAAGNPPEGLSLDNYAAILAGGERIVVIPTNPDGSELVRRIEGKSQPRMPLDGPPFLSPEQIDLIRRWIEGGALDAEGNVAPIPVGEEIRFRGILTAEWEIDGLPFELGGARIDKDPAVGGEVELRGLVQEDGSILETRLRAR